MRPTNRGAITYDRVSLSARNAILRSAMSAYTAAAMSAVVTEEDPLRLTRCMRCAYALETLAPEGTCPECGIAYDQQTVVLNAIWAGNGGVGTGSFGAMITHFSLELILVFIAWTMYWSGDHAYAIAVALFVGASAFVELTYRVYARRAGVGQALLQCRFNRFGCLQCDLPEEIIGLGDLRPIWRWVTQVGLFAIAIAFAWAGARHGHWIYAAVIAGMLILRAKAEWRRRRSLTLAEHDSDARALMTAARACGRQVPATPWSAIADIRVGQFRGQVDRWYLTSTAVKRGFKRDQAINAEVQATPDQIRELKARIAAWKSAARAGS